MRKINQGEGWGEVGQSYPGNVKIRTVIAAFDAI